MDRLHSGKSTVAKDHCQGSRLCNLDTGAMYRAATYLALQNNLTAERVDDLLALQYPISFGPFRKKERAACLWTWMYSWFAIAKVTNNVSWVAALAPIRENLSLYSRNCSRGGIVMDGRDIGTVVLPHAELKIFLVASVEGEAERRYRKGNVEEGITADLELLKKGNRWTGLRTATVPVSPLKPAADAIHLTQRIWNCEYLLPLLKKSKNFLTKNKNDHIKVEKSKWERLVNTICLAPTDQVSVMKYIMVGPVLQVRSLFSRIIKEGENHSKKQDLFINDEIHCTWSSLNQSWRWAVGIKPLSRSASTCNLTNVDLVLIQPQAKPPVAKITDYGKFKFEYQKKQRTAKNKALWPWKSSFPGPVDWQRVISIQNFAMPQIPWKRKYMKSIHSL